MDSEYQAAADCGFCMILWLMDSWDVNQPRLISERTALEDASKVAFQPL